eukprot:scaffold15509_cov66-Phaeocystis_antarctica.AAC.4
MRPSVHATYKRNCSVPGTAYDASPTYCEQHHHHRQEPQQRAVHRRLDCVTQLRQGRAQRLVECTRQTETTRLGPHGGRIVVPLNRGHNGLNRARNGARHGLELATARRYLAFRGGLQIELKHQIAEGGVALVPQRGCNVDGNQANNDLRRYLIKEGPSVGVARGDFDRPDAQRVNRRVASGHVGPACACVLMVDRRWCSGWQLHLTEAPLHNPSERGVHALGRDGATAAEPDCPTEERDGE